MPRISRTGQLIQQNLRDTLVRPHNTPVTMSKIQPQWYSLALTPSDTSSEITRKLERRGIDLMDVPNAVYVIRLASAFLIQYSRNGLSPVLYIGEGRLRARLNQHRKWLHKLQLLLPKATFEVKVCFPRNPRKEPLNKEYESHLLQRFCKQYGQLPLRNRKQQLIDGGIDFSETGRQQVLGPGTGKRYTWAIAPLPGRVSFTNFAREA